MLYVKYLGFLWQNVTRTLLNVQKKTLKGCENIGFSCRICWITVLCSDAAVSGDYYCAPVSGVIWAEVIVGQFHSCWSHCSFFFFFFWRVGFLPQSDSRAFCPCSGFVCFKSHCFHCNCVESRCSGCNFSPNSSCLFCFTLSKLLFQHKLRCFFPIR